MKVKLIQGNVLTIPLDNNSVQTVVTSPPYYGLRDYSVGGQLGLEKTLDCGAIGKREIVGFKEAEIWDGDEDGWGNRVYDFKGYKVVPIYAPAELCGKCFICNTIAWAREVKRVLRPDGTFWLNIGDSYARAGGWSDNSGLDGKARGESGRAKTYNNKVSPGLKEKDLMGVPWRVALALQADGWWLRSDIIWHKPNPMPESVKDRPTRAHEYIFLLTKSARYFYDADAVREDYETADPTSISYRANGKSDSRTKDKIDGKPAFGDGGFWKPTGSGRNKRTVWTITTKPYKGSHFATFPPELPEACIKAGTSAHGQCPDCGDPWKRVSVKKLGKKVKSLSIPTEHGNPRKGGDHYRPTIERRTLGFRPTCNCYDHLYRRDFPQAKSARKRAQREATGNWWKRVRRRPGLTGWAVQPQIVLDPFSGSGTTAMVAQGLGRNGLGVDLSWEYLQLAKERTLIDQLEAWEFGIQDHKEYNDLPLFGGIDK